MKPPKNLNANSSASEWSQRLTRLRREDGANGDAWLQLLYESYLKRFLSDNDRIWTTGQWMIALSLAPLAAIANLPKPLVFLDILFLAIPSVALIWIWLVIAENQRAFQEKSIEWLGAIEKVIGVDKPGGPKIEGLSLIRVGLIRKMRWLLTYGISLIWLSLLSAVALGIKL